MRFPIFNLQAIRSRTSNAVTAFILLLLESQSLLTLNFVYGRVDIKSTEN